MMLRMYLLSLLAVGEMVPLDLYASKATQATKEYTEAVKFIIHIYLIYTESSR